MMRSYPSIYQRRLCRTDISLLIIIVTILTFTTPYIATNFTTDRFQETYISPSARAILSSHNHPLNENPRTRKRVIIYRSLGNSLPPRHALNQTYTNLLFTLHHEPELPHTEKRWYINRLLDTREEARIIHLLLTYRQTFFVDSLNLRDYTTLNSTIDPGNRKWSMKYIRRFPKRVPAAWMRLLHSKTRFVMHCNEARNNMLDLGFSAGAEFVLPGDGNIFFTNTAWGELISNIGNAGYYAVPMLRIPRNSEVAGLDGVHATEEPQILFRRGARERFDEGLVYGRAPKLELLERLSARRLLELVGWCVRLADGSGVVMDGVQRAMNRYEGVERALALADWMAFDGRGTGDGFDIGCCMGILRGLHLSEESFEGLSLRNFDALHETDFCHWCLNTIHELPLNESRTLTDAEKIRVIRLLDVLTTHPHRDCVHEKRVFVNRWCGGYLEMAKQWEAGWWVLRRGLDEVLTAFCGVVIRDYRFATRVASATLLGKEQAVDVDVTEWVGCVERTIARRMGSRGGVVDW